jgi:outer membrane protein assembly factor BamD
MDFAVRLREIMRTSRFIQRAFGLLCLCIVLPVWAATSIADPAASYVQDSPDRMIEATTKIIQKKPFSVAAEKAQVYRIYAYYQKNQFDQVDQNASDFFKVYPNSHWADYVLYMQAMALSHPKNNTLQSFFRVDDARHDINEEYIASFHIFRRLVRAYPKSPYVAPAIQQMRFVRNKLAEKVLDRAKDNAKKQAFLASANRAITLLLRYPHVPQTKEAIDLLRQDYLMLGLTKQAKRLSSLSVSPCTAAAHAE